jgi:hypothetical protein
VSGAGLGVEWRSRLATASLRRSVFQKCWFYAFGRRMRSARKQKQPHAETTSRRGTRALWTSIQWTQLRRRAMLPRANVGARRQNGGAGAGR